MPMKHETKWNFEELTDTEIYEVIRYLEPDPVCDEEQNEGATFVICISLFILLLGCVGFTWLYR